MILFDWGTYNALSTLRKAALLGMKLTEIPPRELSRRLPEDHFDEYAKVAREAFTTIVAHGPYYNLVNADREVNERVRRAMVAAARRAYRAGARIFNVHIGWRAYGDERDIEEAAETVKYIVDNTPGDMIVTLETTYTRRQVGSIEEIGRIMEIVGSERVSISAQLENVFMYELGVDRGGDFHRADARATTDFWLDVLERVLKLSRGYLSLRFSQVTGIYFGRRLLKKRVPLGRGYPSLEPLAEALAEFMLNRVYSKGLPHRMHVIYTGPMDQKYQDTLRLYYEIMSRVAARL